MGKSGAGPLGKQVVIYTDGACSGNQFNDRQRPGGWGYVLLFGPFRKEGRGYAPDTTNNRMELQAAIEALKALKEKCQVTLYTDSQYLTNAFNQGWLTRWQRNNWVKSDRKPVENIDLWQEILEQVSAKTTNFELIWVKGHANNELNNRANDLAVEAIAENQK